MIPNNTNCFGSSSSHLFVNLVLQLMNLKHELIVMQLFFLFVSRFWILQVHRLIQQISNECFARPWVTPNVQIFYVIQVFKISCLDNPLPQFRICILSCYLIALESWCSSSEISHLFIFSLKTLDARLYVHKVGLPLFKFIDYC